MATKTKEKQAIEAVHPHGDHICVCSECGNEITVAEGVKCNTQICPKCEGPMTAKTAGERREADYEALQKAYSDVIAEAGKRNANKDSAKIRQIITLCNDLLSSENPSRESADRAIEECRGALAWLRALEGVKTEDTGKFPSAAYAYAPDLDNPPSWKLRLWESVDGPATVAQLGRAASALSPGGFDGKPVKIPAKDLPAVKRTIREGYRALAIPDKEIPRWVKEGGEMRQVIAEFIPLSEATYKDGVARVTVIKNGFNIGKGHYYSEGMLRRDFGIFEGVKMYADHETKSEEQDSPVRSVKAWVASLQNVSMNDEGNVVGDATIVEPWLQIKLATLRDNGLLSEMGVSINAIGTATKATIEGVKTNNVERLIRARSVDFVTEAGAGGGVDLFEAQADNTLDVDLIDLSDLRERRADLVEEIESAVTSKINEGVKQRMDAEARIAELEGQNATLTEERNSAVTKVAEITAAGNKALAQAEIREQITASELPQAAKDRLAEAHTEDESSEGIAEAITNELAYVSAIKETQKPKDLGGPGDNTEAARKKLREGYKLMNPEWTDADLDLAMKGR